jgi:hypothetical protein
VVPAAWHCVCGLSMLLLEGHSSVDERPRANDAGSFSTAGIFSTAEAPTSYIVAPCASKPRAQVVLIPTSPPTLTENLNSLLPTAPPVNEHPAAVLNSGFALEKERERGDDVVMDHSPLREFHFHSGVRGRGCAASTHDLSDDYIRGVLKVDVSHESCNMIRTIDKQMCQLVEEVQIDERNIMPYLQRILYVSRQYASRAMFSGRGALHPL